MVTKKKTTKKYVIVRGDRSGVFAGTIESRDQREIVLSNARCIWYWDGASSLSQLAMEGTSKPQNCKFPTQVKKVLILDALEILDVTPKAQKSIESVPVWRQ